MNLPIGVVAVIIIMAPCLLLALGVYAGVRKRRLQRHTVSVEREQAVAQSSVIMRQLPTNNSYTKIDNVFADLHKNLGVRGLDRNTNLKGYMDYE